MEMEVAPALSPKTVTYHGLCDLLWREANDPWTYLGRVSTKRCDVLLHPVQSNPLVVQAKVEGTSLHRLGSLREAERSKTIVDRYVQDRGSLWVASINKRVDNT